MSPRPECSSIFCCCNRKYCAAAFEVALSTVLRAMRRKLYGHILVTLLYTEVWNRNRQSRTRTITWSLGDGLRLSSIATRNVFR